jgi:pimeloyl-ACP methyl ester carboxylesterase
MTTYRIEPLLSARLFQAPQIVGDRLYFVSNLSGRLSLYAMDFRGSVPEPLLPPDIALQNPYLIGTLFHVFPGLGKILLMLDRDGDERYQPMLIPLDGGYPEPAFGDALSGYRVGLGHVDEETNTVYLTGEAATEARSVVFRGRLDTGDLQPLFESTYGAGVVEASADGQDLILLEGYTFGDFTVFRHRQGQLETLVGTPIAERSPGTAVELNNINSAAFTPSGRSLLVTTCLFCDVYGLALIDLETKDVVPVEERGLVHTGMGELLRLEHLEGDRYALLYNIDGVSWLYEGRLDEAARTFEVTAVIIGQGPLAGGVTEGFDYDRLAGRYAFAFSTATSPTQLYTVGGDGRDLACHTRERLIGIPADLLSPGEDASFESFDGLRVSARLYLPAPALGYDGPRPLVYYVHGGPQGQERPDFAWFSMPLIQFLTLNGFAVFVPNVRGSEGYGLRYMKLVDRDWGGDDRLDHVHAMSVLASDPRVDTTRAGVIGRSYGGYMTLTLASRHPALWSAAVDMFGPYNLLTFTDRIPETWKPYFAMAVGDPVKDRDLLIERSPSTYIDDIACPLLVIQGQNDPRVIEQESREVVERLQAQGKTVEYLMFPDEGHDVLKYANRVTCYNAINEFFTRYLAPPRGS